MALEAIDWQCANNEELELGLGCDKFIK